MPRLRISLPVSPINYSPSTGARERRHRGWASKIGLHSAEERPDKERVMGEGGGGARCCLFIFFCSQAAGASAWSYCAAARLLQRIHRTTHPKFPSICRQDVWKHSENCRSTSSPRTSPVTGPGTRHSGDRPKCWGRVPNKLFRAQHPIVSMSKHFLDMQSRGFHGYESANGSTAPQC